MHIMPYQFGLTLHADGGSQLYKKVLKNQGYIFLKIKVESVDNEIERHVWILVPVYTERYEDTGVGNESSAKWSKHSKIYVAKQNIYKNVCRS